jgi:hypothetical protein
MVSSVSKRGEPCLEGNLPIVVLVNVPDHTYSERIVVSQSSWKHVEILEHPSLAGWALHDPCQCSPLRSGNGLQLAGAQEMQMQLVVRRRSHRRYVPWLRYTRRISTPSIANVNS